MGIFADLAAAGGAKTTSLSSALSTAGSFAQKNANGLAAMAAALTGNGTSQAQNGSTNVSWTNGSAASDNSANAAALANEIYESRWAREMAYNSAEAQKNRDWQEYMSSTAYQRAMEDMKKAGLNPILAAINGGASSGSGSVASTKANSASMANSYADSYGEGSSWGWNIQNAGLLEGLGAMFGAIGTLFEGWAVSAEQDSKTGKVSPKTNGPTKDYQYYISKYNGYRNGTKWG